MKHLKLCMLFAFVILATGCGGSDKSETQPITDEDTTGVDSGAGSGTDPEESTDDNNGSGTEPEEDTDGNNESGIDPEESTDGNNGSGTDPEEDTDGNNDSEVDPVDPVSIELGSRAEWLSGSWGVAWLPEYFENGGIEGISIQPFLDQMADFKTLDFIQVKLNDGYIYSPVHTAPHKLLESFWYDDGIDRDESGEPLQNLVVPRWGDLSSDEPESDQLKEWLVSIKAMGFKTQIYMNTGNMVRDTIPGTFPDVQTRWMEWCDTNTEAQAFLNSETYRTAAYDAETGEYTDTSFTERAYMFCYLEFVLKDYAVRYGDLIDAWVFDNPGMISGKGDNPDNGLLEDQRIYEAFAESVHAGNPYAALA
ncbi:hypothetical protein N8878_07965, partial [Psychromonas sp.]|nr:hypothetical protein [Psychromonas sp.]